LKETKKEFTNLTQKMWLQFPIPKSVIDQRDQTTHMSERKTNTDFTSHDKTKWIVSFKREWLKIHPRNTQSNQTESGFQIQDSIKKNGTMVK
jgi:hypothetical protein